MNIKEKDKEIELYKLTILRLSEENYKLRQKLNKDDLLEDRLAKANKILQNDPNFNYKQQ